MDIVSGKWSVATGTGIYRIVQFGFVKVQSHPLTSSITNIFASNMAYAFPKHPRGPAPNGIK